MPMTATEQNDKRTILADTIAELLELREKEAAALKAFHEMKYPASQSSGVVKVLARLHRRPDGFSWIVERCPYCNEQHTMAPRTETLGCAFAPHPPDEIPAACARVIARVALGDS